MTMAMHARGFSLIELLASVALLGILAAAALPLAQVAQQRTRESELRAALRSIRNALDAYKQASDEGRIARLPGASGYPPTLAALAEGVPDARRADGAMLYFLRRVPRDPMQPGGWGLRSYASPAAQPRAGADVYDIYSLSPASALDGSAYRDW